MAIKTRQGLIGIARSLYGSFSGKTPFIFTGQTFVVVGTMDTTGITALSSMTTKTTVQSAMDTTGVTVTGSME